MLLTDSRDNDRDSGIEAMYTLMREELLWQYQSARDTERVLHGLSVLDH